MKPKATGHLVDDPLHLFWLPEIFAWCFLSGFHSDTLPSGREIPGIAMAPSKLQVVGFWIDVHLAFPLKTFVVFPGDLSVYYFPLPIPEISFNSDQLSFFIVEFAGRTVA